MSLDVQTFPLAGVKLMRPKLHHDARGYLTEIAHGLHMAELGLPNFVQENQSLSLKKNTVRGLHAQKPPQAQAKMVRVLRGAIYDVAVDRRTDSPTFGQHVGVTLNEDEPAWFYMPAGFLHGFCALTDKAVVLYKISAYYAPGSEVGCRWNDPDLGIAWPTAEAEALLSDKDRALPRFKELPKFNW